MSDEEMKIVEAMKTYGGSFVKALAEAYIRADHYNRGKIRATWDDYWNTYKEMSK